MRTRRMTVLAGAGVLALLLATPQPAAADSAAAIAANAGAVAANYDAQFFTPTSDIADSTYNDPATPDVDIVVDADRTPTVATSLQGGAPVAVVNGTNVSVVPPSLGTGSTVTTVSSTTAVTTGASGSLVNERSENRVRSLIVIDNAAAPTTYTYSIGSPDIKFVTVAESETGNIIGIVNSVTGEALGYLNPAWARDAANVTVPTSYTVNAAGQLVQTIEHAGAAYPVTADPSVSFGWFIYVRYSKSEVHNAVTYAQAYGLRYFTSRMCGMIPNSIIRYACNLFINAYFGSVWQTFLYAHNNNRCVEVKYNYPSPHYMVGWKSYSC